MHNTEYREFSARLKINKNCLDDELELQAQVAFRISEHLARANAESDRCKNILEKEEGIATISFRRGAESEGAKKATVDLVRAYVLSDKNVGDAFANYQIAQENCRRWEGLYEAWKSRGFSLTSLSDLATANYFEVDTVYRANRKKISEALEKRPVLRQRRPT